MPAISDQDMNTMLAEESRVRDWIQNYILDLRIKNLPVPPINLILILSQY